MILLYDQRVRLPCYLHPCGELESWCSQENTLKSDLLSGIWGLQGNISCIIAVALFVDSEECEKVWEGGAGTCMLSLPLCPHVHWVCPLHPPQLPHIAWEGIEGAWQHVQLNMLTHIFATRSPGNAGSPITGRLVSMFSQMDEYVYTGMVPHYNFCEGISMCGSVLPTCLTILAWALWIALYLTTCLVTTGDKEFYAGGWAMFHPST